MRNLLNFLVRYSSWLVFTLYTVVSCLLLFSFNPYQHHLFLTSAGAVASSVYRTTSNITGYFALRDINEDLQVRNAQLEQEVIELRRELGDARERLCADTLRLSGPLERYSFTLAHVINNSIGRSHNYITIEKGYEDGIRPQMGVVDQNGVVGIVNLVGPHTSRIISVLNPYTLISCKVKGGEHTGTLHWDGRRHDEAVLEELPQHAVYAPGDTIVTSGFSSAFPEGVPVGRIISSQRDADDDSQVLRVKLFTDFSTLSTVRVVTDRLADELRSVEQDIQTTNSME